MPVFVFLSTSNRLDHIPMLSDLAIVIERESVNSKPYDTANRQFLAFGRFLKPSQQSHTTIFYQS